jgi:organic radical activating enzyme
MVRAHSNGGNKMYVQLTTRCNMTCEHCCFACTAKGVDIPKAQAMKAIDAAIDACDGITIGGGEPTLHPDFWEILAYAVRQMQGSDDGDAGLLVVTNGKRTEDALALAFLADHCVLSADLSQDIYHDSIDPLVVETFKDRKHLAYRGAQHLPKSMAEALGYCEYEEISYREEMWQEGIDERRKDGEDVDAEEEAGFTMDEERALEAFWETYENPEASKCYSTWGNQRPSLKRIRTVREIMDRGRGSNISGALDECGCDTICLGAEGKIWFCGCKDYEIADTVYCDIYAIYYDIVNYTQMVEGEDHLCSKYAEFHKRMANREEEAMA